MKFNKTILFALLASTFFIIGGWFMFQDRNNDRDNFDTPKLEVVKYPFSIAINGIELNVDVAETVEERAKGLSGRTGLAEDEGMLFLYDEPGFYSFWMKEMNFPIDIIWIGADEKIVDITKNISPDSFPQTFQPAKPAQYVLEVNAGFADRNNINIGDAVDFSEVFPAQRFKELVFVEDAKNHQVIVLNLEGEIIKKIRVGREPHDIALSPDGKFVATANMGEGTVSLINTRTLLVESTIKTGKRAHGIVFSPDGNFLFVANVRESTLSIIEMTSFGKGGIKQGKIKIGGILGELPEYVGITKDGSKIFTTNLRGRGSVTILENEGLKSKIIDTIGLGIDPHGWAISPDGSKIVITNLGSNLTYLLDAKTFEEISHIDTGAATEFAAFRDNSELWVTNIGAHYVSVIDLEQNIIIDQIEVGETPHGISFSSDKALAFVPLYKPGEIVIIDAGERKVVKKVKIGDELHNSVVVQIKEKAFIK